MAGIATALRGEISCKRVGCEAAEELDHGSHAFREVWPRFRGEDFALIFVLAFPSFALAYPKPESMHSP
jgi:hypothetical protein